VITDRRFVEDLELPGTLYGITIRSPVFRGRLIAIDCPKLPNSYTLIRGTDIPGKNTLEDFPVPVLATEELSYIGEPVAILVGPDKMKLEEFALRCQVRTEESAPASGDQPKVLAKRDIVLGDPDKAFEEAKTIVEGSYSTGIQEHWYPEPTGAVAVWGKEKSGPGRITVYTATQWPFSVKRSLAGVLKLPPNLITVEPSLIGIHLDGKIWYPALLACHAALGTLVTKKPVKILLSRIEDFRYSPKRNGTEIRIRSALGEKGQLLASEDRKSVV
jgi:CO/xanthine dehydrogenase Mo-binding subunit